MQDDDSPLKNQDEKAERNYAQRQEELRRAKEEKEIRERIARYVLQSPHTSIVE